MFVLFLYVHVLLDFISVLKVIAKNLNPVPFVSLQSGTEAATFFNDSRASTRSFGVSESIFNVLYKS